MAKPATPNRSSARVVQLRKGVTLEMVRLTCPDSAQALKIAESFGTALVDSDGIRGLHERLIVGTADSLAEGLGERAMQIHLQRVVGAYVGSAHGAGQFYSRAVTEARDATAKASNDARDEDLDGPVGYDSAAQSSAVASYAPTLESYRSSSHGPITHRTLPHGSRYFPKTGGRFFRRPLMRRGQSPSCTICSLMQLRRKSRLRNQRRSLSPPTADTSLGSLCLSAP